MELIRVHKIDSEGLQPQVVVAVPSVNRFLGAFADLYKGVSLCSQGNDILYIALSQRKDGQVISSNCFTGEHKKFQFSNIKHKKEEKWLNYVKGSLSVLEQSFKNFSGLTITLDGNLLQCENSMVYAAITVGMVFGLNSLYKLKKDKAGMYELCKEVFTGFCTEVPPFVNLMTMLFAEKDKFISIDLDRESYASVPNPFKKSEYTMLIVDGNIPSAAMKEELDYTQDILKRAIEHYRAQNNRFNIKQYTECNLNEEDRRLINYLFNEYKISMSSENAFSLGDFPLIGKLFSKMEKGIKDDLELTCPEIDWLIKRSSENPVCLGSAMITNGLGGLIAIVIKSSEIESYTSHLEEYGHIFGFDSCVYEFAASNTVKLIDLNTPALQN